jgi:hypothetical protein
MTRAEFDAACIGAAHHGDRTSLTVRGGALLFTTGLGGEVRLYLNEPGQPRYRISRAAAEALIEEAPT